MNTEEKQEKKNDDNKDEGDQNQDSKADAENKNRSDKYEDDKRNADKKKKKKWEEESQLDPLADETDKEHEDSESQSSDSQLETNFYRNVHTTENEPSRLVETVFVFLSYILMVLTFPISIFMCLIILQEYERAVVLRLGRLRPGGARGPGVVFVLPCVDSYVRVDLRTTSLDVPPQDILTKDSVTISVDAVVYYRIKNALDFILQVIDPEDCCQLLAMTTLRNLTGSYMLIELVSSKKALSRQIKSVLDSTGATEPWGIRIERVEITDILMPETLQRAMAVEQEARREAMAKVAAANGERDAVKALKEAADIMETNPIALQLRYLQTLNSICNMRTEAYVFPFPVDVVQKILK